MLRTSELEYELPEELIATRAAEPRDSARLMVVSRSDPKFLEHAFVRNIARFLKSGDRLVLNSTRVLRARLVGRKPSGGKVEGLFLSAPANDEWIVMLGASHLHEGTRVDLMLENESPSGVWLELKQKLIDEPGAWRVQVHGARAEAAAELERVGRTPLPPYILKSRKRHEIAVTDGEDRARYQTVFAASVNPVSESLGSVAAPTAGLHFTPRLLEDLKVRGVNKSEVVLHVGTGTFRSVETETVEAHPMHSELCSLTQATRKEIAQTRAAGGRVICVGTTSARTVESFAQAATTLEEWMHTRILISPGYQWQWTDGMLTNFHLPRSTLMAMIGSLLEDSGGVARLRELYAIAVAQRYRFYSFGDAMLIVP